MKYFTKEKEIMRKRINEQSAQSRKEYNQIFSKINGMKEISLEMKESFERHNLESTLPQTNIKIFNILYENLIYDQVIDESKFKERFVRIYIHGLGLAKKTDEILGGLNKTIDKVRLFPYSSVAESGNLSECREVILADENAMLNFALNYVDKWQKYNQLFGNKTKKRIKN